METKYSIEWLYNECVNHRHALEITLKGEEYSNHVVIDIVLTDDKEREVIIYNILHGINTNYGITRCKGYVGSVNAKIEEFSLCVEDIVEVHEC